MNLKDTLKISKGRVGLTIRNSETGEDEKVWFDGDKFNKLLDKEDTKKVLLDAMKKGRSSDPEADYKAALWLWNDKGPNDKGRGKKPKRPVPKLDDEGLPIGKIPKAPDTPEKVAVPPKPSDYGNEFEPADEPEKNPEGLGLEDYMREPTRQQLIDIESNVGSTKPQPGSQAPPPPEQASSELGVKSDISTVKDPPQTQGATPQAQDAKAKVMSQRGQDPYTEKPESEEFEFTLANYQGKLKEASHKFKNYFDAKYGKILDNVDPVKSADLENRKREPEWTEQFFDNEGHSGWSFELKDEYEKDPENKDLFRRYHIWMTAQKQQTLNNKKEMYRKIEQKAKDESFAFLRETQKVQNEMKEKRRIMKEEAAKVTDEKKIGNIDKLAKTQVALQKAKDSANADAVASLEAKIEFLKKLPGNEAEAGEAVEGVQTSGGADPAQVERYVEQWKGLGYSPERIAAMTAKLNKLIEKRGK